MNLLCPPGRASAVSIRRFFFAAIWLLLLAAALPRRASAQAPTDQVTGTITDPNGTPYGGGTVKAQLVLAGAAVTGQPTVQVTNQAQCLQAGFGFVGGVCQMPFIATVGPVALTQGGAFNLALQRNDLITPTATQWLLTVCSAPISPPAGFGSVCFSLAVSVIGLGPIDFSVGLSAVAPAQRVPAVPNNFYVTTFGAKPDTKLVTDGTDNPASATVTSASANFSSADVGKTIWLINAGGLVTLQGCVSGAFVNTTTIAAVVNSTTITLANPACPGGAQTGTTLTYGTDDTTAFTNAFNAALSVNGATNHPVACMTIPAGQYIVSAQFASETSAQTACMNGTGSQNTTIFFSPAINWTVGFTNGFMNFAGSVLGGGYTLNAQSVMQGAFTNQSIFFDGGAGVLHADIQLLGMTGPSIGGGNVCMNILSDNTVMQYLTVTSCGGIGLQVHSNFFECLSCRATGTGGGVSVSDGGHSLFVGGVFASTGTGNGFQVTGGSGQVTQGTLVGAALCAGTSGSAAYSQSATNPTNFTIIASFLNQIPNNACGASLSGNLTGVNLVAGTLTLIGNFIGSNGTGSTITNTGASPANLVDIDNTLNGGTIGSGATSFHTSSDCASSASPAACAAAQTGAFVVAAGATSVVVNTRAMTASSEVLVQPDDSLGTKLGVTCNTTLPSGEVSARSAGTSFTYTVSSAPVTNPACFSFHIIN